MSGTTAVLRRGLIALAVLAWLGASGFELARLLRALHYNQVIDTPAAPLQAAGAVEEAASTLFVRAHAAARAEQRQEAMALYQAAARDPAYTVAAQYNLGNLQLREALALQLRNELQHNPQSVELAKRHYRDALRSDPTHWPSKYNLERALQLAPEVADDVPSQPGRAADRVVTSLRGFTLGLP